MYKTETKLEDFAISILETIFHREISLAYSTVSSSDTSICTANAINFAKRYICSKLGINCHYVANQSAKHTKLKRKIDDLIAQHRFLFYEEPKEFYIPDKSECIKPVNKVYTYTENSQREYEHQERLNMAKEDTLMKTVSAFSDNNSLYREWAASEQELIDIDYKKYSMTNSNCSETAAAYSLGYDESIMGGPLQELINYMIENIQNCRDKEAYRRYKELNAERDRIYFLRQRNSEINIERKLIYDEETRLNREQSMMLQEDKDATLMNKCPALMLKNAIEESEDYLARAGDIDPLTKYAEEKREYMESISMISEEIESIRLKHIKGLIDPLDVYYAVITLKPLFQKRNRVNLGYMNKEYKMLSEKYHVPDLVGAVYQNDFFRRSNAKIDNQRYYLTPVRSFGMDPDYIVILDTYDEFLFYLEQYSTSPRSDVLKMIRTKFTQLHLRFYLRIEQVYRTEKRQQGRRFISLESFKGLRNSKLKTLTKPVLKDLPKPTREYPSDQEILNKVFYKMIREKSRLTVQKVTPLVLEPVPSMPDPVEDLPVPDDIDLMAALICLIPVKPEEIYSLSKKWFGDKPKSRIYAFRKHHNLLINECRPKIKQLFDDWLLNKDPKRCYQRKLFRLKANRKKVAFINYLKEILSGSKTFTYKMHKELVINNEVREEIRGQVINSLNTSNKMYECKDLKTMNYGLKLNTFVSEGTKIYKSKKKNNKKTSMIKAITGWDYLDKVEVEQPVFEIVNRYAIRQHCRNVVELVGRSCLRDTPTHQLENLIYSSTVKEFSPNLDVFKLEPKKIYKHRSRSLFHSIHRTD